LTALPLSPEVKMLEGMAVIPGMIRAGLGVDGAAVTNRAPLPGEVDFMGPLRPDATTLNRQAVADLGIPNSLSPRQNLHIPPVTDGRSVLTADPTDLLQGLHEGNYSILRQPKPGQVVVDFGKPIGEFWTIPSGQQPINLGPTNYGSVMYGKKGVHIVPANPKQW